MIGLKLSYAVNNAKGEHGRHAGQEDHQLGLQRNDQSRASTEVEVAPNDLEGAYVAADVVDMSTGEVLIEANHELTETGIAAS